MTVGINAETTEKVPNSVASECRRPTNFMLSPPGIWPVNVGLSIVTLTILAVGSGNNSFRLGDSHGHRYQRQEDAISTIGLMFELFGECVERKARGIGRSLLRAMLLLPISVKCFRPPERTIVGCRVTSVSNGAGDGNRTHVRSLGSFYTAIVRRPLTGKALRDLQHNIRFACRARSRRMFLTPPGRHRLIAGTSIARQSFRESPDSAGTADSVDSQRENAEGRKLIDDRVVEIKPVKIGHSHRAFSYA